MEMLNRLSTVLTVINSLSEIFKNINNINDKIIEPTAYRNAFYSKQIKDSEKLLKTSKYNDVCTQLETQNAVMLVGRSGIGKTSLSFIISNYFMQNQGYNFRFVKAPKANDFDNILNIISKNEDEKEIIIIDDFLGYSTLDLSDEEEIALKAFISSMHRFNNKKFIFTTRETILKQLSYDYKRISSMVKHHFFEIDLDTYNEPDRYNLFKYYCEKNGIMDQIENLIAEKTWDNATTKNIFKHTNFTPLIIDQATRLCRHESPQNYYSSILSDLENPESIWEKEINALDSYSRQYMDVLLSLSSSSNVDRIIVDNCFDKYILNKGSSSCYVTERIHNNIETLIKLDDKYISFVHPSLIEYLDKYITKQTREDIIKSALYLEQIEKMDNTYDLRHIRELMSIEGPKPLEILSLKGMPPIITVQGFSLEFEYFPWAHYLRYLHQFKINDENHQLIVITILKEVTKYPAHILSFHATDIINTFSLDYDFNEIFACDQRLATLFMYANSTNIWHLLKASVEKSKEGYDYSKMRSFIQENLLEQLKAICAEQIGSYDIEEYVNDEMDTYGDDNDFEYIDIIEAVKERLYDEIHIPSVKNLIEDTLTKHSIFNFDDIEKKIDDDEIFEYYWENELIEDEINTILDLSYGNQ